jgi:hypothetical protein
VIYIGIDPGFTGGIAAINGSAPRLWDMPTYSFRVTRFRNKRRTEGTETELDHAKVLAILRELSLEGPCFAMLEKAQVRPSTGGKGQGVVSQAKFYGQFDALRMALTAVGIGFEVVHPATWKADVFRGQTKQTDDDDSPNAKELSRLKAIQICPSLAERLALKKSHGLAEAYLIADYARRRNNAPF